MPPKISQEPTWAGYSHLLFQVPYMCTAIAKLIQISKVCKVQFSARYESTVHISLKATHTTVVQYMKHTHCSTWKSSS